MDKQVLNSLDKYFTRLSQVGYMDYPKVYTLLVELYLNNIMKLLDPNDENFIKDNEIVCNALQCLNNSSCLIDFNGCNC